MTQQKTKGRTRLTKVSLDTQHFETAHDVANHLACYADYKRLVYDLMEDIGQANTMFLVNVFVEEYKAAEVTEDKGEIRYDQDIEEILLQIEDWSFCYQRLAFWLVALAALTKHGRTRIIREQLARTCDPVETYGQLQTVYPRLSNDIDDAINKAIRVFRSRLGGGYVNADLDTEGWLHVIWMLATPKNRCDLFEVEDYTTVLRPIHAQVAYPTLGEVADSAIAQDLLTRVNAQ